eukprot:COSAG02_NODE_3293_length_6997_cov_1.765729_9_plen_88_part_00
MFDAPHGAVVAACMPAAIAINVKALREREPEHDSLKRYTEVAVMLTGCVQFAFLSTSCLVPNLHLAARALRTTCWNSFEMKMRVAPT